MLKKLEELKEKVNDLYQKYDKKIEEFDLKIDKLNEEKRLLKVKESGLKNNLEFDEARKINHRVELINEQIKEIESNIEYINNIKVNGLKEEKEEIIEGLRELQDELRLKQFERYDVIRKAIDKFEKEKNEAIVKINKEYSLFDSAMNDVDHIIRGIMNE